MAEEEKWVPVGPRDIVFTTPDDGAIIVAAIRGNAMFGSLVRKRGGKWMKRELPLVIVNGQLIYRKFAGKDYVAAEALTNIMLDF